MQVITNTMENVSYKSNIKCNKMLNGGKSDIQSELITATTTTTNSVGNGIHNAATAIAEDAQPLQGSANDTGTRPHGQPHQSRENPMRQNLQYSNRLRIFIENDHATVMRELSQSKKQQFSHLIQRQIRFGHDQVDGGDFDYRIGGCAIVSTLMSIIMRAFAVYTNIRVACEYYEREEDQYFRWTVLCLVVPMVITTLLYATMCHQDGKFSKGLCYSLRTTCLVLSSFFFRYLVSFSCAIRCKLAEWKGNSELQKKYYKRTIREESDVSLIRLFECFLETAPQKILQISIALSTPSAISNAQILMICTSFTSMAWCLAVYNRYNRYAQIDKFHIKAQGYILQLCWHFCIATSRVLCIAFVASIFPLWTFVACVSRALLSGVVTYSIEQPTFSKNSLVNFCFCLALGFIYLFTFIPVKDAPTRFKYATYYVFCSAENVACVVLFNAYAAERFVSSSFWALPTLLFYTLCTLALAFYLIGIVFMLIYYAFFHPRITARESKPPMTNERR